nr:hypothetical protein [Tanacetum cinerariifolium]
MADQRTMAELLRAPIEGYADAIVVPPIPAEHFELKHSLINLVTSKFFGFEKEDPLAHIRYVNKITSTLKYKDVPETHYDETNSSPSSSLYKAVEESCDTCGGVHSYRQCPATNGNTFTGYHDNIKGYVSVAAVNNNYNQGYNQNQGNNQGNYQNRESNLNQGNNQNYVFNQNQGRGNNFNQAPTYQALTHQPQVVTQSDFQAYMKANDAVMKNMQTQMTSLTNSNIELKSMFGQFMKLNTTSSSGSGSLPSNTVPNPQENIKAINTRSGVTLTGPLVSPHPPPSKEVDREPETIMDRVLTGSTNNVPPSVVQSLNKEKLQGKDDIQIHSFLQLFKKIHFNISFSEDLAHMPMFAKMVKDLLTNKEKLLEVANTPVNENCSAMILKKLPEKIEDAGRFLIPCKFHGFESCMALTDLGASINLMQLSVWKTLFLPELSTTRMTLELATRTVAAGIAEDVFVQVGKFTFPANFVVVDYEVDPRAPVILGRPFLRMTHALVDVRGENPTFSLDPMVESLSPSLTPFRDSDFLLEETDAFLSFDDSIPPGIDDGTYDSKEDILFLEKLLNDDPTPDLPPIPHPIKSSIDDPSDLELKDLPSHLEYAFLEGTSKLPVIIAKNLKGEEKEQLLKVLKSHKQAIAWKISDIRGINPNFCTHKILMEDDFKPAVHPQRRVNPKIHEVLNNHMSGSPTFSLDPMVESLSPSLTPFRDSDFLLEETDAFLSFDDSIPPGIDDGTYDSKEDILFLEKLLNDDPTPDLPPIPHPIFLLGALAKLRATVVTYPYLVGKSKIQARQAIGLDKKHQYEGKCENEI